MATSNEIREAIDQFVSKMSDIFRRQSLEQMTRVLSGEMQTRGPGRPRKTALAVTHGVTGRPGIRRDPEALAATVKDVGAYIHAHPGQGVEQIKVALGRTSKELALPIKKLLAAKVVSTKGQKRATKYFPAGKGVKG